MAIQNRYSLIRKVISRVSWQLQGQSLFVPVRVNEKKLFNSDRPKLELPRIPLFLKANKWSYLRPDGGFHQEYRSGGR